MKAIVTISTDDGKSLAVRDVQKPTPGDYDLLVAIKAAGINRTDLRRDQQHFKDDGAAIAGLELAGEVVEVGKDVIGFKIGDRVMGMTRGCYAEYATIDSRFALPVPKSMDWVDAAATPIWFMTAYNALEEASFRYGETVAIQAVTSGVGLSVLQLASLGGARKIIGTSRSGALLERTKAFGLDVGVKVDEEDFAEAVMAATAAYGADVNVDMVGKGALSANVNAAAIGGRIVSVGRLGGFVDEIDLDQLALKQVKLIGVTFRTRTIEQKQKLRDEMAAALTPALESGTLKPIVDSVHPLDDALKAQEYMKLNQHFGKIVLEV